MKSGIGTASLKLPNGAVVKACYDEVLPAAKAGALFIDTSTISVADARDIHEQATERGFAQLDAPVSGGPPASGAGTLTVMAGGEVADIERARPLFADVAARFTHMGPTGAGMVAKMLNQLIVGCGHAVMAEAIVLAESAGIDAAKLPESLAGGYADSTLLQRLYPRMLAREFAPQGYARQLLKDLEMVNEFAAGLKAPTPMMGEALSLYRMLVHLGHAELDTGALLKLYER